MSCKCDFCVLHRRIKRTMKSGSHQQKNRLILELSSLYCNTDADLNHAQAVLDGSWPQAVEILSRSLEKAKQHEAEYKTRDTSRNGRRI